MTIMMTSLTQQSRHNKSGKMLLARNVVYILTMLLTALPSWNALEDPARMHISIGNAVKNSWTPTTIANCTVSTTPDLAYHCSNINISNTAPHFPLQTGFLDITRSELQIFARPFFAHLIHLKKLLIVNSNVRYVTSRALTGLSHLRHLSFAKNMIRVLHPNLFIHAPNIEELDLSSNFIRHLTSVAQAANRLPHLRALILSNNKLIEFLYKDYFEPLENITLQEIMLDNCQLRIVASDAFSPLIHLQLLDISINPMTQDALQNLTTSLATTGIKSLTMKYLPLIGSFPKAALEPLVNTSLSHLDISNNHFLVLPEDAFPVIPTLRNLSIINCATDMIYDTAFKGLSNLRMLGLRGNSLATISDELFIPKNLLYLDLGQQILPNSVVFTLRDYIFRGMDSLMVLKLNGNPISGPIEMSHLSGLSRLRVLDLSQCGITQIAAHAFQTLVSLKELDLSGNVLMSLENDAFYNLSNLTILELHDNLITFTNESFPFTHIPSVQVLVLSNNRISSIGPDVIANLHNLSVLSLHKNFILPWNNSFLANETQLKFLGLSYNRLTDFTETMLQDFEKVQTLDLSYNPLDCRACGMDAFQAWLVSTNVSIKYYTNTEGSSAYICVAPATLKGKQFAHVKLPQEHCIEYVIDLLLVLTCSLSALGFLTIVSIITCYYFRWYIRYWKFLLHTKVTKYREINEERQFQYDAFVSYNAEDRQWVMEQLCPTLENQNTQLRLCLHERDFKVGKTITDNILESIEKSRKTVLVLSDAYVKSQWCMFELHMAQHKLFEDTRDALVLVCLKEVDKKAMTRNLRYLIKTRTYIPWTENQMGQKLFWERLQVTMAKPSQKYEMKQLV